MKLANYLKNHAMYGKTILEMQKVLENMIHHGCSSRDHPASWQELDGAAKKRNIDWKVCAERGWKVNPLSEGPSKDRSGGGSLRNDSNGPAAES